ncbi:MarR family winged helix-turn-helix transcriptional regulator [Amycolatopsis orientalis]|uniref:MarR family winged helix-turn-helix transcriptional regulator n=1 Tax=Amycolatopsis orientalis TaxID=31958 RepID=UPI00039D4DD7|nr:MarR family winged helix-turn-helix transcriptional regulator [Amycolatopsis orientalis]
MREPESAEPDYWTFVDHAVRSVSETLPEVDPDAMRLVMTLHRATDLLSYDLHARLGEIKLNESAQLSSTGLRLLLVLSASGPLELRRVAALSGMSRAAVSAAIENLASNGLVGKEPSREDRRTVLLRLTPEGQKTFARCFASYNAGEQHWAATLTADERSQLIGLLTKLMQTKDVQRRA